MDPWNILFYSILFREPWIQVLLVAVQLSVTFSPSPPSCFLARKQAIAREEGLIARERGRLLACMSDKSRTS
jgi:hypothetical protein